MAVQTLPEAEDLSQCILLSSMVLKDLCILSKLTLIFPLAYHVFLVDNVDGQHGIILEILQKISFQNLGNEERRFDIEITKSSLNADDLTDFLENIEVYQSNNQLIVEPQNTRCEHAVWKFLMC